METLNKGDLIFEDELSKMINKYPEITLLDPYNTTHYVKYSDFTKYTNLEKIEEKYIDITKYMSLLIKLEKETGSYTESLVYTDLDEFKNHLKKMHNNDIKDLIMDAMNRRMQVYGHDSNTKIYEDNDYLVMNLNEPTYGTRWGVFHKPSKTYYVYEDNYDELDVFYVTDDGFIRRELIL